MIYRDRADAGRLLSGALTHLEPERPVVLGLPRGGVAVAFEVAAGIRAPLDVILVRKVGIPHRRELAMGAIGEGGIVVVNEVVVRSAGVSPAKFDRAARAERRELDRRTARYRVETPPVALGGRVALIVDDGIATGSTARAACQVARASGACGVVLAAPVGPPGVPTAFAGVADEVVCLQTPASFFAVGEAYADFSPATDAEVVALLSRAQR